jgi:hypothetical protein
MYKNYNQETDVPGRDITTESTKEIPAPAATSDS